ncbi:MAG TPA: NADH-ubiquinone oxidoreductase-F iron-sulfur binding region domain-containing protein [Candidatus Nanoarchaeia archaeon]|nr:NADH-ubiquinone oxidoreductase-F iron-sulfur binding region domain-containing protein [Candidatus Nanoarchaeia archaeon]
MDIISKLKEAGLKGCGGASYPVADKWQAVKDAFGPIKYVICNASEGEPNVFKDAYILKNWPEKVIDGMVAAMDFLKEHEVQVEGYIFINPEYDKKFGWFLAREIQKRKASIRLHQGSGGQIGIYVKPEDGGYICGEETTILNTMEGNKSEPRLKPPFPTEKGLWGMPTIINNVETFYHAAKIAEGDYETVRFYSVNGDCANPGVYKLSDHKSIQHVIAETRNWPKYDFFVQVGGGSAGEILNQHQLDAMPTGAMSITLYRTSEWTCRDLFRHWIGFFLTESCGQCVPCREATYRLYETINASQSRDRDRDGAPDWKLFFDLLDDLSETSFCGLGLSVPTAIRSYIKNVLLNKKLQVKDNNKELILKFFE